MQLCTVQFFAFCCFCVSLTSTCVLSTLFSYTFSLWSSIDVRHCTAIHIACLSLLPLVHYIVPATSGHINRFMPNDPYVGHTALLTSKRCILYIYSTNLGTEYFKHALYSPFFPFQNAVCFIMLTCLVPVLFTFYIQA